MSTGPLLSNGVIALRALEPSDVDLIYKWENDTSVWTATDTQAPYSRHAIKQFIDSYTGDIYSSRQLRLIITLSDTGKAVGTVDFTDFDPLNNRAELGLLIEQGHQGQGLGRMALQVIKQYACEHLGLRQLYVVIADSNTPCLSIFEREGFATAGHLKSWIRRGNTYSDATLMQLVF